MSKHTSFKIGGPADYYIIIETENELKGILNLAKQVNLPITIVGNGTNILVRDGGIRGFVLRINFGEFKINRTKKQEGRITFVVRLFFISQCLDDRLRWNFIERMFVR